MSNCFAQAGFEENYYLKAFPQKCVILLPNEWMEKRLAGWIKTKKNEPPSGSITTVRGHGKWARQEGRKWWNRRTESISWDMCHWAQMICLAWYDTHSCSRKALSLYIVFTGCLLKEKVGVPTCFLTDEIQGDTVPGRLFWVESGRTGWVVSTSHCPGAVPPRLCVSFKFVCFVLNSNRAGWVESNWVRLR